MNTELSVQKERKKRRHRAELKARLIMVCFGVAFISVCATVYAKYFAQSARQGIAIATGIYFTANYAVEVESEEDFFECIVNSDYIGNNYNFDFEIRNYENSLLFNESTVDIPYSLAVWLGEEPVGATYTIKDTRAVEYELKAGEENKIVMEHQSISGGSAQKNCYTISIEVSGASHNPVPIYVEAVTAQGAVINKALRGKMVLNNEARPESFIESQQFVTTGELSTDAEKYTQLQNTSELMYEIKTVGEVLVTDEVTEKLKLSWDPAVFEIDMFTKCYVEWLKQTNHTGPLTDAEGWNYITITVMPYSAETIGFFRGEKFHEKVTDMETLCSYIKAQKEQ